MIIEVRPSREADLEAIAHIYAPVVRTGTASFEEEPPSAAELGRRRAAVLDAGLPHLVACAGRQVVGYAYASPFRQRPAYRATVEDSVYIAPDAQRRGVGRLLLEAVIDTCAALDRRQMIGIVGDPDVNAASVRLHERLGFERCGRLVEVGFKFGRHLDILILQRRLRD